MHLAELLARYGLPALFLGAGVEGETVVVAGGIAAHKGLVSLPGAMAATALGSFVADQIWFLIGRRLSDWPRVQQLRDKPVFAKALERLERNPVGFIFAFRFIYGFRTISPIAIGTSRVPARLFLTVNAVAAIVWGCVFTILGYVAGKEVERLLHRYQPSTATIAIVAAAVAMIAIVVYLINRRINQDRPA